jgi:hypothetical protein
MKQNANVSPVETEMDKTVRRREFPCVRRPRLLYKRKVVRNVNGRRRKKKVIEKRRKGKVKDGGKKCVFIAVDGD